MALAAGAEGIAWPTTDLTRPRPLLLFARAEPAEVTAQVPEGPPRRFRWRGMVHAVASAQGPERIAAEWWRTGPESADARLLPRRGRRRPPLLALPRGSLRTRDRRAALVRARVVCVRKEAASLRAKRSNLDPQAHESVGRDCFAAPTRPRNDEALTPCPATPSLPSPPTSPSCAARRIRARWWRLPMISALRRSASPTATPSRAWCARTQRRASARSSSCPARVSSRPTASRSSPIRPIATPMGACAACSAKATSGPIKANAISASTRSSASPPGKC